MINYEISLNIIFKLQNRYKNEKRYCLKIYSLKNKQNVIKQLNAFTIRQKSKFEFLIICKINFDNLIFWRIIIDLCDCESILIFFKKIGVEIMIYHFEGDSNIPVE